MSSISKINYQIAIDTLKVVTATKYQTSGRTTYCNIFAQDVMRGYGYDLPTGTCKSIFEALYNNGHANYKSVTFVQAQLRANQGYPTIAITSGKASTSPDDFMPEHVAVVYPSGNIASTVSDVCVSQSGSSCFNNGKISRSWAPADLAKVKFYSWY